MTIHANMPAITAAAARMGIFGLPAITDHLGADVEGDVTPELGARVCARLGLSFAEAFRSGHERAAPTRLEAL